MCFACCLMILYICVKFCKNITKGIRVWSGHEYMVEMAMFNVQTIIALEAGQPELRFMYSAHCLMVLYIGVKFSENISNNIRVMEQT